MSEQPIFVFGSNLAGRHGAGAAKFARLHRGAQYGIGEGRTGNAYAIPTKDRSLRTLPLEQVAIYVKLFVSHARDNPTDQFQVTPIGCGLAGYTRQQIAPLFHNAPPNCQFRDENGHDWRPA